MKKIIGIGNALVDILMCIDSDDMLLDLDLPKGSMQLIDEIRMRRILQATDGMRRYMVTGGSASNTICGLAKLGVEVCFIGKVGKDDVGRFYTDDLDRTGISHHLICSDMPSGRCHVLVSTDKDRTMATYLGAAVTMCADELQPEMLTGYDILHIEGYLVQNYDLISRAGELAKAAGMTVSLDLASYNIVKESRSFLLDFTEKYVDIIFANEEEARMFTGLDAREAAVEMASMTDIAVVKLGAEGSLVAVGGDLWQIPSERVDVVDTTGAGDMYAAGFLFGFIQGWSPERCAYKATECAARVIGVMGAKID